MVGVNQGLLKNHQGRVLRTRFLQGKCKTYVLNSPDDVLSVHYGICSIMIVKEGNNSEDKSWDALEKDIRA